ncbi:hypothetical protein OQA88_9631 [Cercophora sp. LCS_1]
MLGDIPTLTGFSSISKVDIQSSRSFLAKLGIGGKVGRQGVHHALEGGAGIGRVTEGLLLGMADQVDIIEPIAKFTAALENKPGIRRIYNVGLEEWIPEEGICYDLIWTQWRVGHLSDEQLAEYLQRCRGVLSGDGGGVMVVKENLSTVPGGGNMFDEVDGSFTREDSKFLELFGRAGLRVVRSETQKGIPQKTPRKLLPVKMYALKSVLPEAL